MTADGRNRLLRALALGGAAAATASLALPWAASGMRWRSAFELLDVARDLGFARDGAARLLLVGVFVVPVLTAGAWVLAALGHPRATSSAVGCIALLVVAFAVVVLRSPLRTGAGVPIGVAASGLGAIGAAGLARVGRSR